MKQQIKTPCGKPSVVEEKCFETQLEMFREPDDLPGWSSTPEAVVSNKKFLFEIPIAKETVIMTF